jgi:hypothetical protein
MDELRDAYAEAGITISHTVLWKLVEQWMAPIAALETDSSPGTDNDADVSEAAGDSFQSRLNAEALVEELIKEVAGK